jgi:hypothetical protein
MQRLARRLGRRSVRGGPFRGRLGRWRPRWIIAQSRLGGPHAPNISLAGRTVAQTSPRTRIVDDLLPVSPKVLETSLVAQVDDVVPRTSVFDDPSKGSNDIVPESRIAPDSVETTIIFLRMASVVWHRIVISRGLVLGGPCFTAGRGRDRRSRHFRVASEVSGSSPEALW